MRREGWLSEQSKKGFRRVPCDEVIKKPLPLPPPDTLVLPSLRATKRTPERRIEAKVIHMNGAEAVQSDDTSPQTGLAVLDFVLVSACSGFGECLLDGHTCALCTSH